MKRKKPYSTVRATIQALGGTASVARELGISMQAVSNWQSEGHIPPGYHLAFYLRLTSQGDCVATRVFGLSEDGRPLRTRRLS